MNLLCPSICYHFCRELLMKIIRCQPLCNKTGSLNGIVFSGNFGLFPPKKIVHCFWSNYSDLTRPHPKWWFSKGNPLISGKSRLVKYYNLARLFGLMRAYDDPFIDFIAGNERSYFLGRKIPNYNSRCQHTWWYKPAS